jgi:transposase-like protein
MAMVRKPEQKALVIKLRVEERKSLREISREAGVSKSTASLWLREHQLSAEEKEQRQAESDKRKRAARGTRARKRLREPSRFGVRASQLPPGRKGWVAEAAVLFRLAVMGFDVYGSSFDGGKFDWVVGTPDGRVVRVQVKAARYGKSGLPGVALCCSNGRHAMRRYRDGEFDVLVGYDLLTDTAYVWLAQELDHIASCIVISKDAEERWDKMHSFVDDPIDASKDVAASEPESPG